MSHVPRLVRLLVLLAVAIGTNAEKGLAGQLTEPTATTIQRLRLFNPDVLGKSVDEAVVLLQPQDGEMVEPAFVLTDIENGIYTAATVAYPDSITSERIRASIDEVYGAYRYKDFDTIWRMEKDKFVVALHQDKEGARLFYMAFRPTQKIFKDMVDAGVFGTDVRDALRTLSEPPEQAQP